MKASKIEVTRYDPRTGEHLGTTRVSANHFKPAKPAKPKAEGPRPHDLIRSWSVLYAHDRCEREIEYWLAHSTCLTREERSEIAHGTSSVIRPIEPDWQKGDVLEVASRVWATVEKTRWVRKGFRTTFLVRDDRPTFPRRVPAIFEPPETDELGIPIKHSLSAIEAARIDGNYTPDPSQAVSDIGDEFGIDYANVLGVKARSKMAERRLRERPGEEVKRQSRAARSDLEETLQGLDMPARLELLAQVRRMCQEAKVGKAA